jgi:cytoskeleton protein RodZ
MAEYSKELLELFAQIGSRLREAREANGITLREISARTRINYLFLEKIEQGDLKGLPGLAFVKGFVRNYLQTLEVSDEELTEALKRLHGMGNDSVSRLIQTPNVNVLDTEPARPPLGRIVLGIGLAILIGWAGFLLFWGSPEAPPPAATQESPPAAATETPAPPLPAAAAAVPAAPPGATAPPAGSAPAATPPAPAAPPRGAGPVEGRQKLELTLRGLEQTWVRLSIDRAPPIDVLMEPAETVGWEANQEIRLTIGKSHGVAVYLNGEEILLPQERNRLIPNLVLNKLTLLRLEN